MRGTWSTTRCPGPVHGRGGWHRCIIRADSCPDHLRWSMRVMAIVWWLRPWWPNRHGRAQDRGLEHVCPNVFPCRACEREKAERACICNPRWLDAGAYTDVNCPRHGSRVR